MTILDWLYLLEGWQRRNIISTNVVVNRSKKESIYDQTEEGWVTSAIYRANDPDITFDFSVEEKAGFSLSLSAQPSSLFTLGIVNPNNSSPWVSVYNTLTNLYVIVYAPSSPLAFSGRITCAASLPSTAANATATFSLIINRILITDKAEFLRSWRALTWGRWSPLFDLLPPRRIVEETEPPPAQFDPKQWWKQARRTVKVG